MPVFGWVHLVGALHSRLRRTGAVRLGMGNASGLGSRMRERCLDQCQREVWMDPVRFPQHRGGR